MKRLLIILAAIAATFSLRAADTEFVFTDATTLKVCGKFCDDTFDEFSRIPERYKGVFSKHIWNLGLNSTGVYIRFSSDSGTFRFTWTSTLGSNLDNMSLIGVRGLALYVRDEKDWMYVGTARPSKKGNDNDFTFSRDKLDGAFHEYMLYLILYDGVKNLKIGVPEGKTVGQPVLNLPDDERPVILYGTSITQGASASHPGMSGGNQLSRLMDRSVVNMGFSGNGYLEPEMAEYLASFPDPYAYVIDNWNGGPEIGRDHLETFLSIIRKAHPDTPILLMGRAERPSSRYNTSDENDFKGKEAVMDEVCRKFRKAGDRKIHHICPTVLGRGNSSTIDGSHFTDPSFTIWADDAYRTLIRICK